MNLPEMSAKTINLYRQIDAKKQNIWQDNKHITSALVALDIHLSDLAKISGLDVIGLENVSQSSHQRKLDYYLLVLQDFLLLANLLNWSDTLEVSDEFFDKVSALKKDNQNQIMILYLSLKNMLLKGYYEKNKTYLKHAWKLFLKWGIVDLGFNTSEINDEFLNKIQEELNQTLN